jgi:hypothetical protein
MQTFSNYKVIEHYDIDELQRIVNLHLDKGWQPIGGIAISTPVSERQQVQFAQALVVKSQNGNS